MRKAEQGIPVDAERLDEDGGAEGEVPEAQGLLQDFGWGFGCRGGQLGHAGEPLLKGV